MNPDSGEILASELTPKEVGDLSMVGPLLEQIQRPLLSVMADGAYDAEPVYRTLTARQPDSPPAVIIPPRATAVLSPITGTEPSLRDRHIQTIQEKGRRGWERAVGYKPTFARRNRHVPLQDLDRFPLARPHVPHSEE